MRYNLPLAGRQTQLLSFQERLNRHQGGLLLLSGEAGVGKSRLIQAWLETASRAGYQTAEVRTAADGRQIVAGQHHETPVIVTWEDLQWADAASLELLGQLAERFQGSSNILLAAYRTEGVRRGHPLHELLPFLHRRGAETLLLSRLTEPEVETLARTAGKPEVSADLFAGSEGNPLFACALLAGDTAGIALAVDERLQGLRTEAIDLLRMAALLGRRFEYRHLLALSQASEEWLLSCLEQAIALAVLAETPDGLHFRHPLVREQLYQELIGPRRTRLHLLAAEIVPALSAKADHLAAARAEGAAPVLLEAGRQELGAGAFAEAYRHFSLALTLSPAPPSPELLLLAGGAARYAAPEQASALFTAARSADAALIRALADHQLAWLACAESNPQAPRLMDQAHGALAQLWREPRLAELQELLHGRPALSPGSVDGLAAVYLLSGRPEAARSLLHAAAVEAGPTPGPFDHAILAEAAMLDADHGAALRFWEASVADAISRRHYPLALYRLALLLEHLVIDRGTETSEIERVGAQLQELVPMARRSGLPGMGARGPLHALWFAMGDWESIRREGTTGLTGAWGAYYQRWLTRVGVADDSPLTPGAAPLFGQYRHAMSSMTDTAGRCLGAGNLAGARAWLECVDQWLAGPRPSRYNQLQNLIGWTEYWRLAGEPGRAVACATAACNCALTTSIRFPALLQLAELQPDRAEEYGQLARAIAERADQPHLLAQLVRPSPRPAHPELTKREMEIVLLVAEGLTDKQIAGRLFISRRTVDGHLRNIFNKLDLTSRSGLVAWAARQNLLT
jgi:DNA-binding CsgD family transcriptional regulator